ncbi:DUF3575 domain-containing protein [Aquimarina sp. SS2-1]|uniref:DUF3575 domain-containing protein n=1 Tax=Aquimarina besae TaxID=3342247 RepID=UPI00366EF5DA
MKKILIILLSLNSITISAQDTTPQTTKHLLKGNLLITPGLEYERAITKNTTISLQLGTELGGIENEELNETRFVVYPVLDIDYRYYYNFKRRARKGKNTSNNNANYFGLANTYTHTDTLFDDIDPDDAYYISIAVVYGLQRTYWKKLNLRFEAGAGYGFSDTQETFVPVLNFTLGWVFWSQSK